MIFTNILLILSFLSTSIFCYLVFNRLQKMQYEQDRVYNLSRTNFNYYEGRVRQLQSENNTQIEAEYFFTEEQKEEVLKQESEPILPEKINEEDIAFLLEAEKIVNRYLDDSDFGVDIFCKELGVSRAQLYRKIKALVNQSVKEFIREIRIQKAGQLLKTTELSIKEVMYEVGFNNRSYFIKCFKEYYHELPSDYRKVENFFYLNDIY